MRINPWMLAGVLAPLVYVAAVVIGGALTPGYSHVAEPISALIMDGAPAAGVLNPLFAVYNALVVAFAIGLRGAFRERDVAIGIIAPALLAVTGLAGFVILFYSMDPIRAPLTDEGRAHIALAAVASLASMLTVLLVAMRLRHDAEWRRFVGYSLISLIVILFSGGFAAAAAVRASRVMGLWERVTIGAFLLWMIALALSLLARR